MRIISPYTARTGRPDQSGLYESVQRFPGVTGLGECCDDCESGLSAVRVRTVPFKRGQSIRRVSRIRSRVSGFGDLGACGAEPPAMIQVGTRSVNCGPQGASDPEQSRACGGSRTGAAIIPIMKTNPAWLAWQVQCAAPVEASDPVQWIRANSARPTTLPRTLRNQDNKMEYIIAGSPGGMLYFVPNPQGGVSIGGGGLNTIDAQGMVNAGGIQLEIPYIGPGFLFKFDPWDLGWQPGGPLSSYRPGLGSSFARDALAVGTWALPIVGAMTGIIGAASAAGSSATAASSGGAAVGAGEAIMPGAQAASSGATGGIIGATEGAATGGGMTTAQLLSAAKTAGGVISAGGAVQKLVATSQAKGAESQALAEQAQAERDAGNLVAAQQLQAQADAAAMQAKSAQGAAISIFGQSIPVWAIAAVGGGALLLLFTMHKAKRGK